MLTGIIGSLGSGKTSTLTFLAKNFYEKGKKIYANYHLKNIEYTLITSYPELDNMKNGYFFADELWLWLDSRLSISEQNKAVSDILLKSRKRGINLFYTTQNFSQIDKRIRNITDYLIKPRIFYRLDGRMIQIKQDFLNPIDESQYLDKSIVRCELYKMNDLGNYEALGYFQFPLESIIDYYDTSEEVEQLMRNKLGKGLTQEMRCFEFLKAKYPSDKIELIADSGRNSPYALDIEHLTSEGILNLYDVKSVYRQHYIQIPIPSYRKYIDLARERKARVYVVFEYNHRWQKIEINDDFFKLMKKPRDLPLRKASAYNLISLL